MPVVILHLGGESVGWARTSVPELGTRAHTAPLYINIYLPWLSQEAAFGPEVGSPVWLRPG